MKDLLRIGVILSWVLVADVRGEDQVKFSSDAKQGVKSRRETIRVEIERLKDHPWAGDYYAGDGLGVNQFLTLAPASGFVFEWHGCLGLYDQNYGAAEWTNNRIRLSFTFENSQKGFQGISHEFVPVSWGERRYLIPTGEFVAFCNSVNDGSEPRTGAHGNHLLRKGDENKKTVGFPKVPAEFNEYLLGKPIEATIISVGTPSVRPSIVDFKFKDTLVTIDAGKKQGLRVGMELSVTQPSKLVESIKITKVNDASAEGIMTQIGENEPGPEAGWKLSTRAPWR